MAIAFWRSASPRVPLRVAAPAGTGSITSVAELYMELPAPAKYISTAVCCDTVSENATDQAPVPRCTDADESSGAVVSGVADAAALDGARTLPDVSSTAFSAT